MQNWRTPRTWLTDGWQRGQNMSYTTELGTDQAQGMSDTPERINVAAWMVITMCVLIAVVLFPFVVAVIVWGLSIDFKYFPGRFAVDLAVILIFVLLVRAVWRKLHARSRR